MATEKKIYVSPLRGDKIYIGLFFHAIIRPKCLGVSLARTNLHDNFRPILYVISIFLVPGAQDQTTGPSCILFRDIKVL